MSVEGVEIVRRNIAELALSGCDPSAGTIRVKRYDPSVGVKSHIDGITPRDFGYSLNYLDTAQVRERAHTSRYFQGVEDPNALHFHPLNYCLGLALAMEASGGTDFRTIEMHASRRRRHRQGVGPRRGPTGAAGCQDLVFCAQVGCFGSRELQKLSPRYLPIATYVVLT